ncbi:hypothetical protein EON65_54120, partial [archaeon]
MHIHTYTVADYVGLIPFFITAGFIEPNQIDPVGWQRAVLAMFEMSITFRIYRFVRYISAVRVVTTAISNSIEHLILPLFFFFVFNITAAVFFYFAEPCYQIDRCPWRDLFESTFFSIVTMSTSKFGGIYSLWCMMYDVYYILWYMVYGVWCIVYGVWCMVHSVYVAFMFCFHHRHHHTSFPITSLAGYGNQLPSYELGRLAAVLVMLFGAIFLSMPLAILGNEYDKAWRMIVEEKRMKAVETAAEARGGSEDEGG